MIKRELASRMRISDKYIETFRVLTSDGNITLFITTQSIKDQYNLSVDPIGLIRGVPVIDIQILFDSCEAEYSQNPLAKELYHQLDESIDREESSIMIGDNHIPTSIIENQVFVDYENLKELISINKLSSIYQIFLLKRACLTLDESVFFDEKVARDLIKKVGRRPKKIRRSLSSRGFGNA